jgi:energy-coupling factor transport system ATP-binding protein
LDEPSSNLDIATIEDLIGVIRHWQSEKKTVIVAEHRLYYLVPYADRILYMTHGSITQEFTKAEFQKLLPDELQGMGLRALDPFHLPPEASPKPSAPQLHIKGFQFSYEKHGPLNVDIPDLILPQGEIIGIIGNNGAGKSTFARCLCGLDKKAKGVLEMDGASYDAKQRRHISYMVMQDVNHQLFTEDVLDELLLSMDIEDEKADTAHASEILDSLDLLDKVKLHPMSLSGGEKQRVAIGSAIASDKKLLIFDEPTSGLDYRHMLEVSDNLNRLKEMGKSLFLITHDPELIYKCCTYLLFIQGSKVLWHRPMDGKAVELLRTFFSHEQETGAVNAS